MATSRRRTSRKLRRNPDVDYLTEAQELAALILAGISLPGGVKVGVDPYGGSRFGNAIRPSVSILLLFDPPEKWVNGIRQNSKYARLSVYYPERAFHFIASYKVGKPRKTRFKTNTEALLKLVKWVDSVA